MIVQWNQDEYLYVLTTTCQKAFILRPYVQHRILRLGSMSKERARGQDRGHHYVLPTKWENILFLVRITPTPVLILSAAISFEPVGGF